MSKSLDAKDVVVVREPGTPDNNILDGGDSPNGADDSDGVDNKGHDA